MNNKKRMMFILEEDYYFITIKVLAILYALDCKKKPFVDYRKLGIIFEFIKNSKNMELFHKAINKMKLDIFENERLLRVFCDSNMDASVIKRILFFLEKQNVVFLQKNDSFSCIDVSLLDNTEIDGLLNQDIISKDINNVKVIQKSINKLRSLKLQTVQAKIFGYSEGTKWED